MKLDCRYKLTTGDLKRHKGHILLRRFLGHPMPLLQSVYPNETFIPWLFSRVIARFWEKRRNRQDYVNWLIKRLGRRSRAGLTKEDFLRNSGGGLWIYCGSLPALWKSLDSDDFETKLSNLSENANRVSPDEERSVFESIREKLGFKGGELEFWYNTDSLDARRLGLHSVVYRYPSLYHALLKTYPSHSWEPWKFARLPPSMIRDPNVIKQSLAYAEKELNITSPEKWYSVTETELRSLGLMSLFDLKRHSLFDFLKKHRPDFDWKESNFVGVRHFGATHLGALLRDLFPCHNVLFGGSPTRKSLSSSHAPSFTIPTLRLAFDYQTDMDYGLRGTTGKITVTLKVNEKTAEFCKAQGLDLISIPFWWDRTLESLIATILSLRPELVKELNLNFQEGSALDPIPNNTSVQLSLWRKRQDVV